MAKESKVTYPRRGEVYLVNFDPTIGAEIKKTRPALILQNDISNRRSPITIVAAITSQFEEPLYPQPDLEYLKNTALTLDRAKALGSSQGKKRLVFAPTKYLDQEHLDKLRIDFAQLPFEIYKLLVKLFFRNY